MAKVKISEYDATAGNNTDIDSISIAEGMLPSNVNNALRELMAHLKDMDAGTQALTSPQLTSVDINGGTIDGAVIGGNSAAAISGTTLALSGNADLNGDLDVDGTTNLDVVDIDGAVNMATTVVVNSGNNSGVALKIGGEGGSGLKTQYILASGHTNYQIGVATHAASVFSITPSTSAGNTTFTNPALNIASNGYISMAGAADIRLTLGSQGTEGNNDANWLRGNGTSLSYNAASANHIWEIGGTERMRITDVGDVGINVSAPVATLHVHDTTAAANVLQLSTAATGSSGTDGFVIGMSSSDVYVYNRENTPMRFGTNDAERMRISSGGEVLFGKTSTSANVAGGYIDGGEAIMSIADGGNTYLVRSTTSSSYTFYVTGAGVVNAVTTSINGLSDIRLKENIVDLETGLSEIMGLKPRRFDWKEGKGSNEKNVAGFIAQEVETVLPDLIGSFEHDEIEDAKSVKMGDMIPTLVKAMQEQQTIIKSLTDRITALEG